MLLRISNSRYPEMSKLKLYAPRRYILYTQYEWFPKTKLPWLFVQLLYSVWISNSSESTKFWYYNMFRRSRRMDVGIWAATQLSAKEYVSLIPNQLWTCCSMDWDSQAEQLGCQKISITGHVLVWQWCLYSELILNSFWITPKLCFCW